MNNRHMLDYLPPIMRTYQEFIEMANAEQIAKDKMWENLDKTFKEAFVSTESEIGAIRWEKTLGITPKDNEDIEIRNFRIRGRIQADLPYTYRILHRQLTGLCGADGYILNIDYEAQTIMIKVALTRRELANEVVNLADEIIPAHLELTVELMYNTHGMIARAGKTHAELASYTHLDIREKAFE